MIQSGKGEPNMESAKILERTFVVQIRGTGRGTLLKEYHINAKNKEDAEALGYREWLDERGHKGVNVRCYQQD